MKLRTFARRVAAEALHVTGLSRRLLTRRTRSRVVVLTYHRVLPHAERRETFSAGGIVVSDSTFRRQMSFVREHLSPLNPDELAAILNDELEAPARACLVTFDDGWWDNSRYAAPILEEVGVPALIFLATDFIGTTATFWQEQLSRSLHAGWQRGKVPAAIATALPAAPALRTEQPQAVRRGIRAIIDGIKRLPPAQRVAVVTSALRELAEHGMDTSDAGLDRFMTWNEVRALTASKLISIGSHGCSHTPLTDLDSSIAAEELRRSRNVLETEIGHAPSDFAYPNGDHDTRTADLVREAGYRMAFSTARGYVGAHENPYSLPRLNIHEDATNSDAAFLARLISV